jgi:membrane protease YdiL (CAAX protease family)
VAQAAPEIGLKTSRDRGAIWLGLGIALYGNGFAVADWLTGLPLGGTVGGGLIGLSTLALGRRAGQGWTAELGLRREGLARSAAWGLMVGLALGLPGLVKLLLPDLGPLVVDHGPLRQANLTTLLTILLLKIPLATALCEELVFRGLLQARLRRTMGSGRAVLYSTLVFTAWHLVVNFTTLQDTSLAADPTLAGLASFGQAAAVFVGGLAFGVLRERTGNLAGPIVAHTMADVLLVGGVYFGR